MSGAMHARTSAIAPWHGLSKLSSAFELAGSPGKFIRPTPHCATAHGSPISPSTPNFHIKEADQ
jgi:hypothetical protein